MEQWIFPVILASVLLVGMCSGASKKNEEPEQNSTKIETSSNVPVNLETQKKSGAITPSVFSKWRVDKTVDQIELFEEFTFTLSPSSAEWDSNPVTGFELVVKYLRYQNPVLNKVEIGITPVKWNDLWRWEGFTLSFRFDAEQAVKNEFLKPVTNDRYGIRAFQGQQRLTTFINSIRNNSHLLIKIHSIKNSPSPNQESPDNSIVYLLGGFEEVLKSVGLTPEELLSTINNKLTL